MSESKVNQPNNGNKLPTMQTRSESALDFYFSADKFDHIQRVAIMFSKSSLVPDTYKGGNNLGNCIIAIELASRMKMSPFMAMQNLNVIKGKPSWSSTMLIATLNACGRFKPLKFVKEGAEGSMDRSCYAWTTDLDSDEKLIGPKVTMKMAKEEGWLDKTGSKWKTMPELMLMYRAAAFFSRLYAPEIGMGMQTTEEIKDVDPNTLSETTFELIDDPLVVEEQAEIVEEATNAETEKIEEEEKEQTENADDPKNTPMNADEFDLTKPLGVVAAIQSVKSIAEINKFKKEHKEEITSFTGKEDALIQTALKEKENSLLKAGK